MVVAEVYAGLNPSERSRGQELLGSLRFFATSLGAARQAGLWRYAFARQGVQLATTDCLIAAIAQERGATPLFVTGNTDDYPMPELHRVRLPRRELGEQGVSISPRTISVAGPGRLGWGTVEARGMLDVPLCVSASRAGVIRPGMFRVQRSAQTSWKHRWRLRL